MKRTNQRYQQHQQRMNFLKEVPTKCLINITESLENAKYYEHFFKLDGLLVDPPGNKE